MFAYAYAAAATVAFAIALVLPEMSLDFLDRFVSFNTFNSLDPVAGSVQSFYFNPSQTVTDIYTPYIITVPSTADVILSMLPFLVFIAVPNMFCIFWYLHIVHMDDIIDASSEAANESSMTPPPPSSTTESEPTTDLYAADSSIDAAAVVDASSSEAAADESSMIPLPPTATESHPTTDDLVAVESSINAADAIECDNEIWSDALEELPRVHWPDGDGEFATIPFKPSSTVGHTISSKMYTNSPVQRWYLEEHARQYAYVCQSITGLLSEIKFFVPLNDEGRRRVRWADGDFVHLRFRPHAKRDKRGHSISSRVYSTCVLYRKDLETHMKSYGCVLDQLTGLISGVHYPTLENEEEIAKFSMKTFVRTKLHTILESPDEHVPDEGADEPAVDFAPVIDDEQVEVEEEGNDIPIAAEEVVVPSREEQPNFEHLIDENEVEVEVEVEVEEVLPRKRKRRMSEAQSLESCLGKYWVAPSSERPNVLRRSTRKRTTPDRFCP